MQQVRKPNSKKNLFFVLCSLFFISYWLFLIKPAWLGQLGGTFKARPVPQEYIKLKDFINNQNEFFRTFWVPQRQRFGFFSNNHPAIDGAALIKVANSSAVVDWLNKKGAREQLSRWGVKYVIIPFDSGRELFLEDRKYSKKQRAKIRKQITNISWLKRVDGFGRIDVFETSEHYDRFFIENTNGLTGWRVNELSSSGINRMEWEMINPAKYKVELNKIQEPVKLVFSENFDKGWEMKTTNNKQQIAKSIRTDDGLNSFKINATGDLNITVEYAPQSYVNYGIIIAGITLFNVIGLLVIKGLKG